jgi:hypothetical protein
MAGGNIRLAFIILDCRVLMFVIDVLRWSSFPVEMMLKLVLDSVDSNAL